MKHQVLSRQRQISLRDGGLWERRPRRDQALGYRSETGLIQHILSQPQGVCYTM